MKKRICVKTSFAFQSCFWVSGCFFAECWGSGSHNLIFNFRIRWKCCEFIVKYSKVFPFSIFFGFPTFFYFPFSNYTGKWTFLSIEKKYLYKLKTEKYQKRLSNSKSKIFKKHSSISFWVIKTTCKVNLQTFFFAVDSFRLSYFPNKPHVTAFVDSKNKKYSPENIKIKKTKCI